jgi:ribonuclease P protein component
VFAQRQVIRGVCFDLLRNTMSGQAARLGLIVPKRLAKRAVLRNLIKRQVREAFRHMAQDLPPGDLVLRLSRMPKALPTRRVELKKVFRSEAGQLFGRIRGPVLPLS